MTDHFKEECLFVSVFGPHFPGLIPSMTMISQLFDYKSFLSCSGLFLVKRGVEDTQHDPNKKVRFEEEQVIKDKVRMSKDPDILHSNMLDLTCPALASRQACNTLKILLQVCWLANAAR